MRQRSPRIRLRLTVPSWTLLLGRPNQTQSCSRIGFPLKRKHQMDHITVSGNPQTEGLEGEPPAHRLEPVFVHCDRCIRWPFCDVATAVGPTF